MTWPPHDPLSLKVTYTIKYSVESLPLVELIHTKQYDGIWIQSHGSLSWSHE